MKLLNMIFDLIDMLDEASLRQVEARIAVRRVVLIHTMPIGAIIKYRCVACNTQAETKKTHETNYPMLCEPCGQKVHSWIKGVG